MNVSVTAGAIAGMAEYAPRIVNLTSVEGKGRWWAGLEPNTVTLYAPGSKRILTVPREDVARHIRFAWDVRHGRTVSFVVVEGMRSYTFRCDRHTLDALLTWLPRKPEEAIAREVQFHAAAMYVAGMLLLARYAEFGGWWATLFAVLGTLGLAWRKRGVYAVNGTAMVLFGFAQIVSTRVNPLGDDGMFPSIAAAVMLCWAVQQFSMLGVNAQIRAERSRRMADEGGGSRLVRRVGTAMLAASGALWAYGAALAVVRAMDERIPFAQVSAVIEAACPELAVVAVLALFATSAGVVLRTSRRPAYLDAKVAAQVLIAGAVFLAWSVAVHVDVAHPLTAFGPLLSERGLVLTRPLAWLTLLPAVLAFNRWFSKRMDRELEGDEG